MVINIRKNSIFIFGMVYKNLIHMKKNQAIQELYSSNEFHQKLSTKQAYHDTYGRSCTILNDSDIDS